MLDDEVHDNRKIEKIIIHYATTSRIDLRELQDEYHEPLDVEQNTSSLLIQTDATTYVVIAMHLIAWYELKIGTVPLEEN